MDKLKELLDGLVAEKSLSFEVLDQLRKVKTESDALIKVNFEQGEILKEKDRTISRLNSEINGLTALVKKWSERDENLTKRENAVLDIEHKNEIEKLKATHSESTLVQVKEIVAMVFKNTSVKRSVFGIEACPTPQGGYTSTVNTSKTEEIKEE